MSEKYSDNKVKSNQILVLVYMLANKWQDIAPKSTDKLIFQLSKIYICHKNTNLEHLYPYHIFILLLSRHYFLLPQFTLD